MLRGVVEKWAWSKAEGGGGGGLTWPLVLRIFGMVSITFFFAPPSGLPISFKLRVLLVNGPFSLAWSP